MTFYLKEDFLYAIIFSDLLKSSFSSKYFYIKLYLADSSGSLKCDFFVEYVLLSVNSSLSESFAICFQDTSVSFEDKLIFIKIKFVILTL